MNFLFSTRSLRRTLVLSVRHTSLLLVTLSLAKAIHQREETIEVCKNTGLKTIAQTDRITTETLKTQR